MILRDGRIKLDRANEEKTLTRMVEIRSMSVMHVGFSSERGFYDYLVGV